MRSKTLEGAMICVILLGLSIQPHTKCLGLCGWILSRRKTEEVDRAFEMAISLQIFLSSQHNTINIEKILTFL